MSVKHDFPKGLYGITDPNLLPATSLYTGVEAALKGGCKVIQYRNKQADYATQLSQSLKLAELCQQYQACFIINDQLKLALDCNADGVHLGKTDGDILTARKKLGSGKYIGVTCHNDLDYAKACIDHGVDYCAFGRFFPSKTKPDATYCSPELLSTIAQLPVPIVAIGGITVDNMSGLMDTPINNIAVIHGLFGQANIEAAASALSQKFLSLS